MKWVIKSKHVNDEDKVIAVELEDEDGSFNANIRWDGSMEIHIQSLTEENNYLVDTIHTYDLEGLITKLEGLNALCMDYFDDWNGKR
ncbi:hypothetical protein [Alkalihalobacillus sp. AL-G]|uniref:hypothetical protein n=1 Tax=Alkalihalobacillus sp. AL-G TaxID=2926399 RepID=UPI00272DB19A|nr:hypothetical protein [Alkalihalobacillus sp. AL-G]WLD93813.1 hypothetical protein MOJ78_02535 [Alkalihalobacillus sp. AL-G]